MIVNRRTFKVKHGKEWECVEMVKAENERLKWPVTYRIYMSNIAPWGQMVVEWEFEDLAAYDKFWTDWQALPETEAYMKKWRKLTRPGGANEIWDLVE
ncbi:MAG: hypothetical protein P1S60_20170 [Anaerolineae bacterium]|nr:hypothetical protein [Anaerolineae bacterium]